MSDEESTDLVVVASSVCGSAANGWIVLTSTLVGVSSGTLGKWTTAPLLSTVPLGRSLRNRTL